MIKFSDQVIQNTFATLATVRKRYEKRTRRRESLFLLGVLKSMLIYRSIMLRL
jgi:hypothetical protein